MDDIIEKRSLVDLRVDVLKRALSDIIFPEERRLEYMSMIDSITEEQASEMLEQPIPGQSGDGSIWPPRAETMIGISRLNNLHECMVDVIENNIPGDFIETGVWRGGAAILMRYILKQYGVTDRMVYAADSFEGLPKPDVEKWPEDAKDRHYQIDYLKVGLDEVKANFEKYGVLDNQVEFIKGFFEHSLKNVPFESLAVLRMDGDMYGSTMEVFNHLYDKVSVGGYIIIDDYALRGCHKAVNDFRKSRGITEQITYVDWTGIYWKKTK